MTFDEKLTLLHQHAPAVPRLGLADFRTGTEILHGVSWLGPATVFPQAVGLGATWNPDLLEAIGAVVGTEVHQLHHLDPTVSRNVWGPVVNLLRDPRWGRNEEGYSEDPTLTAMLAIGYCRGLRGGGPADRCAALVTAPTLKHFLAYNHETDKGRAWAEIRPRVLHEYDLRPFERVIRAGVVSGVMLSYNRVNGRPCHVTPLLPLLRSWQPDLVVVSDAHGTKGMVEDHGYFEDLPHAYAAALRAGLDSFTNDSADPIGTVEALRAAAAKGLLSEEDVDAPVRRLLRMRARLGELGQDDAEPVEPQDTAELALTAARQSVVLLKNDADLLPLDEAGVRRLTVVGPHADKVLIDWVSGSLPYHHSVLDVLRDRLGADRIDHVEGVDRVVLEVDGGGFVSAEPDAEGKPLRIASVGSDEERWFDVFDWGGDIVTFRAVTNRRFASREDDGSLTNSALIPYGWAVPEAFTLVPDEDGWSYLRHVYSDTYVGVCDGFLTARVADPDKATRLRLHTVSRATDLVADRAAGADAVLVVVGTHPLINGRENEDTSDMALPRAQEAVVRAALAANPKTALVMVSGRPIAAPWLAEQVPALLWSAHGGQEQGQAIVDTVLGTSPPAGRLPQTWYRDPDQLGDLHDYDIIGSSKTYLYFPGDPLYPFGHGLTYARFRYGEPRLDNDVLSGDDACQVTVTITNTGPVASDEVVQLYVRAPGERIRRPIRELRGFRRIHLPVDESAEVSFRLDADDLAHWDVGSGRFVTGPGRYELQIGRSSADIVGTVALTVTAPPVAPRDVSGRLARAVDFDDSHDIRIVDEAPLGGDAVAARGDGGWLCFRDVELPDVDHAVAQVATTGDVPATVELRLDDPATGHLVAWLTVPVVDRAWRWCTVQAPANGNGRHDLYVVLSEHARLASFGLVHGPHPVEM
ncbi:beta-glucosidase [Saccharothrix ecbatanensis]|uniref:Exo-alpha-(1->6)-L-arabinopyranosidase n=1 Tax=Saccharothrix ecbatanensis TaxID=1105145 RepID=A0A7W9HGT5_9PSEU|nr:glycoside hydrolase family 3 protein [Saccharothrix ecbatanensis]MBB5801945.1 beta-glucosidase [Saccharothrix ecbatanensis]